MQNNVIDIGGGVGSVIPAATLVPCSMAGGVLDRSNIGSQQHPRGDTVGQLGHTHTVEHSPNVQLVGLTPTSMGSLHARVASPVLCPR